MALPQVPAALKENNAMATAADGCPQVGATRRLLNFLSLVSGTGRPGCSIGASKSKRLGSDLTGKLLLTRNDHMVGTPDREQAVFGAISHPARRRMRFWDEHLERLEKHLKKGTNDD